MTFDPSVANGQTVMDVLQLQATLAGYSLVDPDAVTVEPASGLAVDVTFNTEARLAGPAESVDDVTGHSLPSSDPDNPRKVLLYLDANGDVQSIAGDAAGALPEGEVRMWAGVPDVPIPNEPFLPLEEIWLAAGASSITNNDISSRRMPFAQGEGSGLNADLFRGSDTPEDAIARFGLYPTEVDQSFRTDIYNDFGMIAESYSAMNTIVWHSTIMDEVAASESAIDAIGEDENAMSATGKSDAAMDSLWGSTYAWDAVATNNTWVTKFVAGRAGLDVSDYDTATTITDSEDAMTTVVGSDEAFNAATQSSVMLDAIANSETAMGVLTGSNIDLDVTLVTNLLLSPYVTESIWHDTDASNMIWDEASSETHYSSSTSIVSDGSPQNTPVTYSDVNGGNNDGAEFAHFFINIDATDVEMFKIDLRRSGDSGSLDTIVDIDGSRQLSYSNDHGWNTWSFDLSGYSGETELRWGGDANSTTSSDIEVYGWNLRLE